MEFIKLFECSSQPMWVFDPQSLRFLVVNEAAVMHYGYSRDDFAIMTINDIRPLEDLPRLQQAKTIAGSQGDHHFPEPFRHLRRNGSIIDVKVTRYEILHENEQVFLIIPTPVFAPGGRIDYLEQLIRNLEFHMLQRITKDDERFKEILVLANQMEVSSISSKQIAIALRIRELAIAPSGTKLN